MVKAVPGILSRIVEQKRAELRDREPDIEARAALSLAGRRDFRAALLSRPVSIIAEIKKASPSRGVLAEQFDPPSIASSYERGGAAALSVLTDQQFFQGSFEDLQRARSAVSLPVLRKDFTIGDYHVHEAAAHGADAILLIAAILSQTELTRFRELAGRYRMAALAEVHDEDELRLALDSGADLIGVNSRDLNTFVVDLNIARRLAERIPDNVVSVAESGIHSAADIESLRAAGYRTFLVGEHLMKAGEPESALRSLLA